MPKAKTKARFFMQLPYQWSASFLDASHSVILTKPGRKTRILVEYRPTHPRLRVLDLKSRLPLADTITHFFGDELRAELLRVCAQRWPAESAR